METAGQSLLPPVTWTIEAVSPYSSPMRPRFAIDGATGLAPTRSTDRLPSFPSPPFSDWALQVAPSSFTALGPLWAPKFTTNVNPYSPGSFDKTLQSNPSLKYC